MGVLISGRDRENEGSLNAAKHREVLAENLLQDACDQRLGATVNFSAQQ